ncbi:MAG TPA: carboxypeptidase-like regulatory domain-containing protein [Planctomycetia bacterium]|nr:carboxypeptidase-like regulatory domain-containing protein [Planctomycetia bacterium]
MDVGLALVLVLATNGYQGKEVDFAALPQYSPSKEWVAKAIEATGRKATEIEIEDVTRLFDGASSNPGRRRFPEAALIATDGRWQADCDAIAQEVYGRKATVPELYWFGQFGLNLTDARARARGVKHWASKRPAEVAGKAIDQETDKPIARARVVAERAETTTDADGKFSFKAPPDQFGEYKLWIHAEGRESVRQNLTVGDDGIATPLEVRMAPGVDWEGKVIDVDGQPAENASAVVMLTKRNAPDSTWRCASTDGQGRFRFPGLSKFHVFSNVHITTKGGQNEGNPTFDPAAWRPGDAATEIRLQKRASLAGTVFDAEGKPAPLAEIQLRALDSRAYYHSTLTDRAGRFTIPVCESGTFHLTAEKPGHALGFAKAEVKGEPLEDLKIELPAGDYIEGTVLLPDGKPAAGCNVGWCAKDAGPETNPLGAPTTGNDPLASNHMTATDENGKFKAGPFPVGARYRLLGLMGEPRRAGTAAAAPGTKEMEIRLQQTRE